MKNIGRSITWFIPVLLLTLSGCGDKHYVYGNTDDGMTAKEIKVPLGNSPGRFSMQVETGVTQGPNQFDVYAAFFSSSAAFGNLQALDLTVLADGKEIVPDTEQFSASYRKREFVLKKDDCCLDLCTQLAVDTSDQSTAPVVSIMQKFTSPGGLPQQLTVRLFAKTTQGVTDTSFVMNLKEYRDSPLH